MLRATAVAILLTTQTAAADIAVRFVESAPKDRFIIENLGDCALTAAGLTLDMAGSAGGLIFDVTGSGAGVEVFQPFDLGTELEKKGCLYICVCFCFFSADPKL